MITKKYIQSLSPETIELANEIHREFIRGENEETDAAIELHALLNSSIEDFILNLNEDSIDNIIEEFEEDEIEVLLVKSNKGWFPSVRTSHIDAPSSTVDDELAVPSIEQALVWGFGDAIIAHALYQGILLTDSTSDEPSEALINKAIKQIEEDLSFGDKTAIAALLSFVPKENLKEFLSEEQATDPEKVGFADGFQKGVESNPFTCDKDRQLYRKGYDAGVAEFCRINHPEDENA